MFRYNIVARAARWALQAAPAVTSTSGSQAAAWTTGPQAGANLALQQARRWASSQGPEGASLNPLDQLASPSSIAPERKTKKPDLRFKFQEKGAFGENVYTKGHSKNLSISPYKLNDFVKVLRGLSIHDAIIQCQISVKKSAKLCEQAIVEARKKAVDQNGADPNRLRIDEMWVGKGRYLKRMLPHSRGRMGVMHKYRAHLTVMLKEEPELEVRTRIIPMLAERVARKRQQATPAQQA